MDEKTYLAAVNAAKPIVAAMRKGERKNKPLTPEEKKILEEADKARETYFAQPKKYWRVGASVNILKYLGPGLTFGDEYNKGIESKVKSMIRSQVKKDVEFAKKTGAKTLVWRAREDAEWEAEKKRREAEKIEKQKAREAKRAERERARAERLKAVAKRKEERKKRLLAKVLELQKKAEKLN